jgi:hypothetical protein
MDIIIRDHNGNIYSSASAGYQFSAGKVDELSFSADIGIDIYAFAVSPETAGIEADLYWDFDFSPPGTFEENYSIEVLITKYVSGQDSEEVNCTIW